VPSCLNYVRSALAVADCNFGGAEQVRIEFTSEE